MRRRNVEGQMRGGSKTGLQFARIHGGHVEGVHQKVQVYFFYFFEKIIF